MTDTPFVNRYWFSAQKCTVFLLEVPVLRCSGPGRVTMWVIHTHCYKSFRLLNPTKSYPPHVSPSRTGQALDQSELSLSFHKERKRELIGGKLQKQRQLSHQ